MESLRSCDFWFGFRILIGDSQIRTDPADRTIGRALLISEIALTSWIGLIDRDCLCADLGGNIVGDQ